MFNRFSMWLIWFCFAKTRNMLAFFGIKMKLTEVSLATYTLQWRHNEPDGVSNHRRIDCLLKRLFMCRSRKTSMLTVTSLCEGNPLLIVSLLPNVIKAMSMFQYPIVRIRNIVRSCDVLSNFETHLICWGHNVLAVRLPLPPSHIFSTPCTPSTPTASAGESTLLGGLGASSRDSNIYIYIYTK